MTRVGGYDIERELARAEVSTTFEAMGRDGRAVRLRVLELPLDEAAGARLEDELAHVATLRHPSIDRPVAWSVEAPVHVATGLLPSAPLRAFAEDPPARRMAADIAVCVAADVAEGMHAAHLAEVVHAGLSLDAILVGVDGRASVTDFGLLRFLHDRSASDPRLLRGAIESLAPEQLAAPPTVSTATDVFGLGLVLYRTLTGKPAFDAPSPLGMSIRLSMGRPTPIESHGVELADELRALVMKMLSASPTARPSMELAARTLAKLAGTSRGSVRQRLGAAVRARLPAPEPEAPAEDAPARVGVAPEPPVGEALASVELELAVEPAPALRAPGPELRSWSDPAPSAPPPPVSSPSWSAAPPSDPSTEHRSAVGHDPEARRMRRSVGPDGAECGVLPTDPSSPSWSDPAPSSLSTSWSPSAPSLSSWPSSSPSARGDAIDAPAFDGLSFDGLSFDGLSFDDGTAPSFDGLSFDDGTTPSFEGATRLEVRLPEACEEDERPAMLDTLSSYEEDLEGLELDEPLPGGGRDTVPWAKSELDPGLPKTVILAMPSASAPPPSRLPSAPPSGLPSRPPSTPPSMPPSMPRAALSPAPEPSRSIEPAPAPEPGRGASEWAVWAAIAFGAFALVVTTTMLVILVAR